MDTSIKLTAQCAAGLIDSFAYLLSHLKPYRRREHGNVICNGCRDRGINKLKEEVLSENEPKDFIWMLTGNIIPAGYYEIDKKLVLVEGTKHFIPGSKVYSTPIQWGDGYERTHVIARHKENQKLISIIMETRFITNWRIQKVYTPYVIRKSKEHLYHWDNSDKSKEEILEMLEWLPERSLKSKLHLSTY